MKCPNKNLQEWKDLEAAYPKLAYYYWNKYDGKIPNDIMPNNINYTLKAVDILQSDKAKRIFEEGAKKGWGLERILNELEKPEKKQDNINEEEQAIRQELNKVGKELGEEFKKKTDKNNTKIEQLKQRQKELKNKLEGIKQPQTTSQNTIIPKAQKELILEKGLKNRKEIIASLLTDNNSQGETIYFHKVKELAVTEDEFKQSISKNLLKRFQDDNTISELKRKEANGKLHIRTTLHSSKEKQSLAYVNDRKSRMGFIKAKPQIIDNNLRRIQKYNDTAFASTTKPFIIEKVSDTYTSVEVNPAFLQEQWGHQKEFNKTLDRVERDNYGATPNTHNPFSAQNIISHQKTTESSLENDTLKQTQDKINTLQQVFASYGIEVTLNGNLPPNVFGRVKGKKIELNPNQVRKDTVIHEFGHIFVDSLGGMNNNFIKRGRKLLNGSKTESEVIKNNPELSGETLDKEILVTAIGKEGANLYNMKQQSPFKAWVKIFLNKIRLLFHMNGNVALELANRMLNTKKPIIEGEKSVSNYWNYSKTMTDGPSSKDDSEMERIITQVHDKIIILQKKYAKSKSKKFKEAINKLLNIMESHRDARALIRYVDETLNQSLFIEARLRKLALSDDIPNGKELNDIRVFMGTFDLIKDVKRILHDEILKAEKNEDYKILGFLERKKESLNKAEVKLSDIHAEYDLLNERFQLDIILKHNTKVEYMWRTNLEKQFREINKGHRVTQQDKENYVNQQLEENKNQIEKDKLTYAKKLLYTIPKDISQTELFGSDPKNLDSNYISTVIKLLDRADFNAMRRFIAKRNEHDKIHKDLYEYKNKESNQGKLYDELIEKIDGKRTNHLVGRYYSTASDLKRELIEKKKGFDNVTKEEWKDLYKKIEKLKNPQWDVLNRMDSNHPVRKAYEYLTKEAKEKDAIAPIGYKLGLSVHRNQLEDEINIVTYKLPAVEKTTIERLYEQGIITSITEGVKDVFSKDSDYIASGEVNDKEDLKIKKVLLNESGEEHQTIPVHYRKGLKKDNQQSFDLFSISLIDMHSILNYDEKEQIKGSIEVISDSMKNKQVRIQKGGKWLMNALGSSEDSYKTVEGINSNIYKALNSIVQDRLYGVSAVDIGDIHIGQKTISGNKIANAIMRWTGGTMLMLNKIAGSNNVLQGKYQNFLESIAGNHYDRKNIRHGEKLYDMDYINIMKDVSDIIPKSFTNLMIEKFNAFADFEGLRNRFAKDNKFKRLANEGSGYIYSNVGEHYIQGTVMYAILDNTKVNDGNGNIIPLHQAYELINGKLATKKGIIVDDNLEYEVGIKIQEVIKQLHGNYNSTNQAMIQRYVSGKLIFMLRKWMFVGVQRRWRGIKHISDNNKDLLSLSNLDDISYNHFLKENAEGYYTTTVKYLIDIRKELARFQFKLISTKWNELTDLEKGNIKKTITDMAVKVFLANAALFVGGLAKGAPDKDKNTYYTVAYTLRRQYSEIAFYTSINQGLKVLQTPAASISFIKTLEEAIAQTVSHPTEVYQRGSYKGKNKALVKIKKTFPIFSQSDRNIRNLYNWMVK